MGIRSPSNCHSLEHAGTLHGSARPTRGMRGIWRLSRSSASGAPYWSMYWEVVMMNPQHVGTSLARTGACRMLACRRYPLEQYGLPGQKGEVYEIGFQL